MPPPEGPPPLANIVAGVPEGTFALGFSEPIVSLRCDGGERLRDVRGSASTDGGGPITPEPPVV